MPELERNEYDELIEVGGFEPGRESSGYDAAIDRERESRVKGLRARLHGAGRSNPDQVARNLEIAERAGVPRAAVERNPEQAQQIAERDETDYDELIDQYEQLSDYLLSDPDNARVSADDIETLKRLHGVLRERDPNDAAGKIAEKSGLDWLTSVVPHAFKSGQAQVELGQIGFRQITGQATEAELERAAELERQVTGDTYGASGWWQESVVEASRQLPILIGGGAQAMERGAETGVAFGTGALIAGQAGPQAATPEEVVTVPAATATGLAVGGRIGVGEFSFQLESGMAYREYLNIRNENGERIDPNAARMGAVLAGIGAASAEVFGFEVLARSFPGAEKLLTRAGRQGIKQALRNPSVSRALAKLAQRYGTLIGSEAGVEAVQEGFQILGGEIAKGLSDAEFDAVTMEEAIDRAARAAKVGAQATSILGIPGPGSRFVADTLRVRQARQNQETIRALGEAASESKTRQRAPKRFREFVERVREGGPIESVHVPVERWNEYFQSMELDPAEVASEVTGDNRQYAEAQATGGDLVIPVERYAERLAATEHHGGLARDLRLRPGDMTAREADEFAANATAAADPAQEPESGTETAPGSDTRVFSDVLGQLLNAGVERSAAEQQATLYQSAFRSIGERAGKDPFELYQKYGLRIRREIPELLSDRTTVETIDPLLDRLRAGEVPTEREARGPSLVEFLREGGGVLDEGGELSARDPDEVLQPFQRRLIRPEGEAGGAMTLEEAAQRAAAAGYFAEIDPDSMATSDITPDMLLDAIDRELKGEAVFAEARADARVESVRRQLLELDEFLMELGVDLQVADNETARQILEGQLPPEAVSEAGTPEAGEEVLAQEAAPDPLPVAEELAQLRQRVAELENELRTDDMTGLRNRRAFEEDAGLGWPTVGALDMDGLKRVNNLGHAAGDRVIRELASVLLKLEGDRANVRFYRTGGDEFTARFRNQGEAHNILAELQQRLEQVNVELEVTTEDGGQQTWIYEGIGLSFGVAPDEATADARANQQKQERERLGLREPPRAEGPPRRARRAADREGGERAAEEQIELFQRRGEFEGLTSDQLRDRLLQQFPDVDVDITGNDDLVTIHRIVVPEGAREAGAGSAVMDSITEWADARGVTLALTPSGDFGGSVTRLRRFYRRFGFVANKGRNKDFSTQEAMIRPPREDVELPQRDTRGPRGRIRFTRDQESAGSNFTIELLQNADLSTFLHETGHFFLEVMGDLAADPGVSDEFLADYGTVLEWLGVSSREEIGAEQHEQWARGFEAYLFEGRAPTEELQTAFAKFRAWLVAIYRQVRALNVELTEDVRRVMDRLVAADDEITAAREEQNYTALFDDAIAAGMTEAEFAEYRRMIGAARSEAEEELARRALSQLQREQREWWRQQHDQVREEVTAEIDAEPGFQAMYFLQRGELPDGRQLPEGVEPVKLDREILVQRYGEAFLKRLPRPYVYRREGGVDPDFVAEIFGFDSGDALVRRLAELPPRRKAIEAETDQRMRDRYGDMLTDGTLPEAAQEAVHNERRSDLLQSELRALGRRTGQRAQPGEALRASAERIIRQKSVSDIRPDLYRRAEAKASRRAFEAAAVGDYETAYQEKQRQTFNHHLYREARRAREETDRIVAYMAQFERKTTRQRIARAGGTYLEQIDALMDTFEFRRNVSLRRIRQRQSFREWLEERRAEGHDFIVDDALQRFMGEARRVNYRELTYEALTGLRDSVKFIEHLAQTKNQLLAAQAERDFNEAVADIVGSIEVHHEIKEETLDLAPGLRQKVKDFTSRAMAEHTKPEFLFQYLDGENQTGPAWQRLFKPINDAKARELELQGEIIQRFQEIWSGHPRGERRQWYTRRFVVEGMGVTMNKANLLSLALNWGNEQNREAVLEGYGWSRGQVEGALRQHLDQRDWDAVQATWDLIDSLWPQIKALEEELNGIAPKKVEAAAVDTPYGTYRGGYYPLKYDTRLSNKAFRRLEREAGKDLFENNYARAATKRGHTIERVGSGGQKVRLDMSVATEHLHQAIHDITHRKAVMDVDKLSQDPRVRKAIEATAGREMYRQIRPWLQSVAREQWTPPNAIQDILSRARAGATVVNMGWKVTTAIVQPLGYSQSIDFLGVRYGWKGLQDFYSSPRDSWAFVRERSTMMVNRTKTFDRDVKDAGRRLTQAGHMDTVRQSFFYFIGLMDMSVSVPTWLGAYQKAMDGNAEGVPAANEPAAIDYADQTVRLSQSAGDVKDLAGIQRHSELMRIFTMFYSYFNGTYNMMQRRTRQVAEGRISRSRYVASLLYLWWAPAVLSELVAGRGPEDDEEWWKWAVQNQILYATGTVVFVRDIANAALTPFGFEGSPAFDAPSQTARSMRIPYKLATGEDLERSDVKSAVLAASYWGALPGRQMWITGEYTYDVITGEEDPEGVGEFLRNMAFSRPASERD